MMLKLSVLDQSPSAHRCEQSQSIRDTLELAQRCEAWGYHRFWVSEHHSHPAIVGSAPEVLMAAIAARTQRIRIGSAGIMLPHYAALKVAEQFRVLDALAPGRIDLGIGRAPGSDQRTARLLNPHGLGAQDFPQQALELQAWVQGRDLPPDHPGHGVKAVPTGQTAPQLWMLGSSDYGAQLAAYLGWPYAFAWFITDGQGAEQALHLYRSQFMSSAQQPAPHAALCVWALVADTAEEAWHEFESRQRFRMDRRLGRLGPLLPPDQARRDYAPEEQAELQALRRQALVGTAGEVARRLKDLASLLQAQEVVVISWTHGLQARLRSYELLAETFDGA
jgi:luciferase family oxidoreductase group 1